MAEPFVFLLLKKRSLAQSSTAYMITFPKTHSKYCGDFHDCSTIRVPTVLPGKKKKKNMSETLKQLYFSPVSYFDVNVLAPLEKEATHPKGSDLLR